GHTELEVGVFDGEQLYCGGRWATDRLRMADEYAAQLGWLLNHHDLSFHSIDRTVLSSVVPVLTTTFRELVLRYIGHQPLIISAALNTGVRLEVDNPVEVGGDRIANAFAAKRLFGTPAIVVDFGTATNFDVVSADG